MDVLITGRVLIICLEFGFKSRCVPQNFQSSQATIYILSIKAQRQNIIRICYFILIRQKLIVKAWPEIYWMAGHGSVIREKKRVSRTAVCFMSRNHWLEGWYKPIYIVEKTFWAPSGVSRGGDPNITGVEGGFFIYFLIGIFSLSRLYCIVLRVLEQKQQNHEDTGPSEPDAKYPSNPAMRAEGWGLKADESRIISFVPHLFRAFAVRIFCSHNIDPQEPASHSFCSFVLFRQHPS